MTGDVPNDTILSHYRRLAAAQKPPAGVSLYSRYINRPWGRWIAAVAYPAGLTPNQVTGLSATCTGAAALLLMLVPPQLSVGLAVGFLLMLGFALDSADGQLARLRGGGSKAGEFADHLVDSGKTVLLHTSVLIAAWRFWEVSDAWLLVPLAFQLIAVMLYSGTLLAASLLAGRGKPAQPASLVRGVALLPGDHGVISACFLLTGWPWAFTWVYSLLMIANAAIFGLLIARWSQQLSRYEQDQGR